VSSMEVYGFGSSPYVDDKGKGAGKSEREEFLESISGLL
jgi:hypothetical protein